MRKSGATGEGFGARFKRQKPPPISPVPAAKFGGSHPDIAFEVLSEGGLIRETKPPGNFLDGQSGGQQHFLRLAYYDVVNHGFGCISHTLLAYPMQVAWRDMHLFGIITDIAMALGISRA